MYRVVLLNPEEHSPFGNNHHTHTSSTLSTMSSGDDANTVVVESDASDSWRTSTLKGFNDSLHDDNPKRDEPLLSRAYFS